MKNEAKNQQMLLVFDPIIALPIEEVYTKVQIQRQRKSLSSHPRKSQVCHLRIDSHIFRLKFIGQWC